ncbi:MAG: hypothetical protein JSU87_11810 [Gemmatimonadota bacterium]|nr:MAG: hypothetical protein JSU87_11810 [Gemmatimonadota bacterium]
MSVSSKALIALMAAVLPSSALAQTTGSSDSNSLRGRHGIELSLGFLSEVSAANELSVGGLTMTSEANGVIGSIAYDYWFADDLAFGVSLGVASANASTSVTGTGASMESATVMALLFGLKYKPIGLAVGDALRPYLYASLGPYFGFASDVRSGTATGVESYTETALGSRAGLGIDLSLGRSFTLGVAAGYRLVSDFARRIGSETNYSSPEFSLSAGILIGRGRG